MCVCGWVGEGGGKGLSLSLCLSLSINISQEGALEPVGWNRGEGGGWGKVGAGAEKGQLLGAQVCMCVKGTMEYVMALYASSLLSCEVCSKCVKELN